MNFKAKNVKNTKLIATTMYTYEKNKTLTVLGVKEGKQISLLYSDKSRIVGMYTQKELLDHYVDGSDSLEVTLGIQFLEEQKLITAKNRKIVEANREKRIKKLDKEAMNAFVETVELIKEEDTPTSQRILERLRKIVE